MLDTSDPIWKLIEKSHIVSNESSFSGVLSTLSSSLNTIRLLPIYIVYTITKVEVNDLRNGFVVIKLADTLASNVSLVKVNALDELINYQEASDVVCITFKNSFEDIIQIFKDTPAYIITNSIKLYNALSNEHVVVLYPQYVNRRILSTLSTM